jgi:VWFA-related protein
MRAPASWAVAPLVSVAVLCLHGAVGQAQPRQLPQFRAGVTLVPVEVRVVDRNGSPVRDLTKADFVVKEAGILQEVAHLQTVDSETAAVGRTFVVVLGRGRLNDPTNAVKALADFVRVKLFAADRVGVVAYRQAIPPTTDHERVATFLDRYQTMHSATESLLARDLTGRALPQLLRADTRAAIEATFQQEGLTVQDLAGADGNSAIRYVDFLYLKNALYYLRFLDGDKHVVVVTEEPFPVGRVTDNLLESFWFLHATSARATLNFIHAGGLSENANPQMLSNSAGSAALGPALGLLAQESVAEQTGGSSSFFQDAAKSLAALERSTRFYYVVGYYPTREVPPDQYREIDVSIRRPGARISYRRGYQAQPPNDSPDVSREALTAARMADGAWRLLNPDIRKVPKGDLGITWETRLTAVMSKTTERPSLQVTVAFDPLLVGKSFEKVGDRYLFEFELVLLADDEQRKVIAETKRHIKMNLSAAEFAQIKRRWPTFDVTLEVKSEPAYVRGVLYHFETDRIAIGQTRVGR